MEKPREVYELAADCSTFAARTTDSREAQIAAGKKTVVDIVDAPPKRRQLLIRGGPQDVLITTLSALAFADGG